MTDASVNLGAKLGLSAKDKESWTNDISSYRDDRMLPTSRLSYISNHPTTQLANLYSDEYMISPTWGKISSSPWYVVATLIFH
jgi:hypothetical protein